MITWPEPEDKPLLARFSQTARPVLEKLWRATQGAWRTEICHAASVPTTVTASGVDYLWLWYTLLWSDGAGRPVVRVGYGYRSEGGRAVVGVVIQDEATGIALLRGELELRAQAWLSSAWAPASAMEEMERMIGPAWEEALSRLA